MNFKLYTLQVLLLIFMVFLLLSIRRNVSSHRCCQPTSKFWSYSSAHWRLMPPEWVAVSQPGQIIKSPCYWHKFSLHGGGTNLADLRLHRFIERFSFINRRFSTTQCIIIPHCIPVIAAEISCGRYCRQAVFYFTMTPVPNFVGLRQSSIWQFYQ